MPTSTLDRPTDGGERTAIAIEENNPTNIRWAVPGPGFRPHREGVVGRRAVVTAALVLCVCALVVSVLVAVGQSADGSTTRLDVSSGVLGTTTVEPVTSLDATTSVTSLVLADATMVEMTERDSGSTSSVVVPGRWVAIVADYRGDRVALMPDLGEGRSIYQPGGRADSRIAMVTWSTPPSVVTYTVPGNVVPEAFSHRPNGSAAVDQLFVIDHRPALDPTSYQVRAMPLSGGPLRLVLGPDKTGPVDEMQGVGRQQVAAPDGRQLYTLYSRQIHRPDAPEGNDHHDAGGSGTDGFVHILDLEAEWAYCLDLPETYGDGPPSSTAIAVSPTGDRLAVVDTWAGELLIIDTAPLLAATATGQVESRTTRHALPSGLDGAEDLTVAFTSEGVTIDEAGNATTVLLP